MWLADCGVFLLLPVALVYCWEYTVARLFHQAWPCYRWSGLIGAPAHELAHAFACLLFGMKIDKLVLYEADPASGRLGYVRFRYRPNSLKHSLGLVVQGFAPLLLGAVVVVYWLDLPVPQDASSGLDLMLQSALDVAGGVWSQVNSGPVSAALTLLVGIVAMHAIPSRADLAGALRGGIILALLAFGASMGLSMLANLELSQIPSGTSMSGADGVISSAIQMAQHLGNSVLFAGIYGFTAAATYGVITSAFLLVLPALAGALWRKYRQPAPLADAADRA